MAWSLLLAWANSPALSITRDQLMLACIRPYFRARYEAVSALIRDTRSGWNLGTLYGTLLTCLI